MSEAHGRNQWMGELQISTSVFVEAEFFALVFFTFLLPACIYGYMLRTSAISRKAVLLFGVSLIAISGVNIFLLQRLAQMAKESPSLLDDKMFTSEISVALYLLPAVFAGIGVNILSHVLIGHLAHAEKKFDREH